ncbi:MAG: putative ABC transporter permease [Lachnospiraceae bacterium]|nr:putative ABC transporter permease [Lachnospiraceae bacterium]
MSYTWSQLGFFLFIYAFLGWFAETAIYAITRRRFANVGFLTLPLLLTHGITMMLLAAGLPSLEDNPVGQFVLTVIISSMVEHIGAFISHMLCPGVNWPQRSNVFGGTLRGFAASLTWALCYFVAYLILHPLVIFLLLSIPDLLLQIIVGLLLLLVITDMIFVTFSVRRNGREAIEASSHSSRLAKWISNRIWKRIQKAYPGIRDISVDDEREIYTFAKGLSADKIVWIFLLSAFIGDLIETVYCRLVGGSWMNRSSVLYGPFSFVWGFGAVLLTIALSPLAKKNDRWVFFGGFFAGGAYEYLCSVFTELLFGTVFWDYSYMPLNIGGRTNVLFMFFWGVLSVFWIKVIYPAMSSRIEKIPPTAGIVITWLIISAMLLNGTLTTMAILRYNIRKIDPQPRSSYDMFIDSQYPDEQIERQWPNMIVVDKNIS